MAATRRSGSDIAAPTFSYAQAAKGIAPPASTAATSKPSSETITSVKDTAPVAAAAPVASMNWADSAEVDTQPEKPSTTREARTLGPSATSKPVNSSQPPAMSNVVSPDLCASSSSTVTKDDDNISLLNNSSESTWENKSQASTSVDKTAEPAEKTSEKVKKGKDLGRASFKPLQEAPLPAVNIWKLRADEAKAKAAQKITPTKPTIASSGATSQNGVPQGPSGAAPKKNRGTEESGDAKEKGFMPEGRPKGRDEEKGTELRKDTKPENDTERLKKGTKGRPLEKNAKPAPISLPLPPDRDQESWPTPETAIDEDRKKAQVKGEKSEKERKEGPSVKQEWVKVPYTPNVIFNTPLPNAASSRRGGRGGGRGGAQTGGRTTGFGTNGAGHNEKDASAPATLPNGDQPKRGRPDAAAIREASPKGRRNASSGSPMAKDKALASNGEKLKNPTAAEFEVASRKASVAGEAAPGSQAPGQNNTFPRQYPRSNKSRRGEVPGVSERKRDGELVSPTKENGAPNDRRVSAATQTDAPEDGDRRASNFQDGQSKQGPGDRRPYGQYSGRDRTRGGGRGGRGGYQNGHQFTNGHPTPLQTSSSFPLPRSPTSFYPEQSAYFPAPPNKYRNSTRSQSVTADMYRLPGYPGGPPVPPIQTYMGNNVYDYPMMQPMSAVPFNPYGMDQFTLFNMVTTQLEYYFSVDNLIKDMFLRKHMDSQGFVFLSFIAGFNRVKQLTADMELIKLVCHQSHVIEYQTGVDGKDRLRPREGWEQWVLPTAQRDPSAQNDGPEELHSPPMPHPHGFDQPSIPQYPDIHPGSPNGMPVGNEGAYPSINGFHSGVAQPAPVMGAEDISNGIVDEDLNGSAIPNGHPVENPTKAVSHEPDSFSDEQVESLTVIVRKQDQTPALPPSASRTFSNGSIDSRSGMPDESEKMTSRLASLKANGTSHTQGNDSEGQDQPRRALSPFTPAATTTPVRLYWVKDKDAPVDSIPPDSTHESYYVLRSKALQQRQNSLLGSCPHDMDVLYQFWSHFLIRNFNTRMYDEFRHFAFEDAAHNMSEIGLTNLIKFYGESLLSPQNLIRERVARHYVDLVRSENEHRRPAFKQLRSALRNGTLEPRNRIRIGDFLDDELKASLE